MKFNITTKVDRKVEIDVTFPLFLGGGDSLDESGDSWDYFIRIDGDGNLWRLTARNIRGNMEYEFEHSKIDLNLELSTYWPRPGSTYHLIDAAAFSEAIKEAQGVLNAFPVGEIKIPGTL